ncbi:LysR family transcriptional regulator [Amycolatopsis sp. TNS106]|uniref:LysR family transcriptional regulator n=1 Tax=Amycolatopsis sp. TNS106 TaxID=2861750 RepID=UPI001C58F5A6|nr:LysR family transcriptional regulator [Amycolatopsis sp. TNS106]QXV61272.1 LysR family transcriptional regulator [Amycolatopsis sp. TNS106]
MFSLEQLVSFVAVAEELHYGRAAERLSMTQPPLSRRIQLLERELGVELFDRTHRAVRMTPAGRVFLAEARKILRSAQEATLYARRAKKGEAGVVSLGFTATAAYSSLERVIAVANAEVPGVDLVLRELVTAAQVEELLAGGIDLGLIRPPVAGADVVTLPLWRERLLAALPSAHPLARRKKNPDVRDFDGEPFIMYSPSEGRYFHDLVVAVFRSARVLPEYTQYPCQVHTVLALVKAELGVALVPAAAAVLRFEGVVLRPVDGVENRPVELELMWRRSNDNPALGALLAAVGNQVRRARQSTVD